MCGCVYMCIRVCTQLWLYEDNTEGLRRKFLLLNPELKISVYCPIPGAKASALSGQSSKAG